MQSLYTKMSLLRVGPYELDHLGLPTEIPQARPPPVEKAFDESVQLALHLDEFDGVDVPTVYAE